MNRYMIEDIYRDTIKIAVIDYNDTLQLHFSGALNMPVPNSLLLPLFEKIHEIALEKKFPVVYLNITDLEFMSVNASRCFIEWIVKIAALDKKDQYRVIFTINLEKQWQKSSFSMMYQLYNTITEFHF